MANPRYPMQACEKNNFSSDGNAVSDVLSRRNGIIIEKREIMPHPNYRIYGYEATFLSSLGKNPATEDELFQSWKWINKVWDKSFMPFSPLTDKQRTLLEKAEVFLSENNPYQALIMLKKIVKGTSLPCEFFTFFELFCPVCAGEIRKRKDFPKYRKGEFYPASLPVKIFVNGKFKGIVTPLREDENQSSSEKISVWIKEGLSLKQVQSILFKKKWTPVCVTEKRVVNFVV